jgi:hypothetical protein
MAASPAVSFGPVTKPLAVGAAGAGVAVLAAGAATLGRVPLVAAVAVVQVVVALAWLAFLDAPAALVSFLIAIAAAGGCDVAALRHSGTALGGTVGVVAIAMMVALVVELGRKPRSWSSGRCRSCSRYPARGRGGTPSRSSPRPGPPHCSPGGSVT